MGTRLWLDSYRRLQIPEELGAETYATVVDMLDDAATKHADRVAFRSLGQSLTYAEVVRLSLYFCAWLQGVQKIRQGDRVGVMVPNLFAFPIAMLGIARAGAIQVNINPQYTARELRHQLRDSGCRLIVIFNGATPALAEVIADTDLESVVTVALGDCGSARIDGPLADRRLASVSTPFSRALSEGASLEPVKISPTADDVLFLQYTGGTTGVSKGAILTHRNLLASARQFKAVMTGATRQGEERVVTAIPVYHIFALVVNFISYFSIGAENWLVPDPRDLDALIAVFRQARPSVFSGVNTLYAALAMHPGMRGIDFSNLRLAVGGGAAILEATSSRWQAVTGTTIREGYGLSETSAVVAVNPMDVPGFTRTVGLPVPGTDVRLLDDDGREVEPGSPGEICVNGPQVMRGYWNQPEANAAAFTADRYFRTGDIGIFDERGFLKIVDRKKDMILISGFNVYPNEVEEVATTCDGVAECACVGFPDEKTGEAVALFVVKRPNAELTAQDVLAHCRVALAAYKVPKDIRFVDSLPKSPVGKILRRDLKNLAG